MKLIIYGLGQIFQRYKNLIPMKAVEAFVDKNAGEGNELFGIPVVTPQRLSDYEYDYLVVFSDKFFYQIQRELSGEYFVPKGKIVSWRIIAKDQTIRAWDIKPYLSEHIKAFNNESILEFGLDMMYGIISPAKGIYKSSVSVDGVGEARFPYEKAFYRRVWADWTQADVRYDLTVVKPGVLTPTLAAQLADKGVPNIIVIEKYDFERLNLICELLNRHFPGRARSMFMPGAAVWEIVEQEDDDLDCVDYVVTHKKYRIQEDGLYKGLCVGQFQMEGLLSELDGQSIASYNDRINETTALYWIWKNTSSEYVGLSHYRRMFYNNAFQYDSNYLSKGRIKEILCDLKYDIILSELKGLDWTIYDNIEKTVGPEYNTKAYQLFMEALKKKQPDYVEAFEHVMQYNRMYICNMFVTSRKILDAYCSWLFSFYLDVVDQIDVSAGTSYQKRVTGYYSEVFWTVWMLMQQYKVYELPLTDVFAQK